MSTRDSGAGPGRRGWSNGLDQRPVWRARPASDTEARVAPRTGDAVDGPHGPPDSSGELRLRRAGAATGAPFNRSGGWERPQRRAALQCCTSGPTGVLRLPVLGKRSVLRLEGTWVLVSGVAVDERLLRHLSEVVPRELARRLDTALFYRAAVLGLTVDERKAILAALEKPPAGLEDLRTILLEDPAWRQCESI